LLPKTPKPLMYNLYTLIVIFNISTLKLYKYPNLRKWPPITYSQVMEHHFTTALKQFH